MSEDATRGRCVAGPIPQQETTMGQATYYCPLCRQPITAGQSEWVSDDGCRTHLVCRQNLQRDEERAEQDEQEREYRGRERDARDADAERE